MWYVYVLEHVLSPAQPILGCTNRLWESYRKEIEARQTHARAFLPIELVYYEAYMTERAARTRLKNLERYDDVRQQLKEQIAGRPVTND